MVDMKGRPTIDWTRGTVEWDSSQDLDSLTLLAVGDILFEGSFLGIVEDAMNRNGGDFLFGLTRSVFLSADVVLGNLENPLCENGDPIYKWGPNFRASPKVAKILSAAGFAILGVANNHMRDFGDRCFLETLDHITDAGMLPVGGGSNASLAYEPVVIRKESLSIGILAFTFRQESVAGRDRPGAADLDDPKCYEAVRKLRNEVDLVIVFVHMDPEYSDYPAPHRIEMAHNLIDSGAEIVIGHHPHVFQGLEIYKGKLIAYSLGNFLFHTQRQRPLTSLGYILKITFAKKTAAKALIIPYKIIDCDCSQFGRSLCQPTPLTGYEFQNAMKRLYCISESLKNPKTVRLNWEGIASRDVMQLLAYIVRRVMRGRLSSFPLCHYMFLKYRCIEFLKSLQSGKALKYLIERK